MVQMPETRPAAHQAHLHPDRAVPKFGTLRSQNFYPEIVFCVPHENCHWGLPQFHGLKQIHFETKLLSRTRNAINAQEGQLQSSRPQGPVHPPGWTIGAHWDLLDLLGWCPCFSQQPGKVHTKLYQERIQKQKLSRSWWSNKHQQTTQI